MNESRQIPPAECIHPPEELDRSDTEFSPLEVRCKCRLCERYVKVRDKNAWEIAQLVVPTALAAGGAIAAVLGAMSQRKDSELRARELQQAEIRCPSCQSRVVPTKIIETTDPTLLSRINIFSEVEQNYTGCPNCKTPISWCAHCRRVTESSLNRELDLTLSKTGYQNVQRCKICKNEILS
jgi:hypothetical protein